MNLRDALAALQDVLSGRRGSMVARLVWLVLGALIAFRIYNSFGMAHYAARLAQANGYPGNVWWLTLRQFGVWPWLILAAGWLLVLLRLRPHRKAEETLVQLTRFWYDYRKYPEPVREISHEGYDWPLAVDAPATGGREPPRLRVIAPRCPKCRFEVREERFAGGWYRVCDRCGVRQLSRSSLDRTAGEILGLAREAWRLTRSRD